MASMVLSTGVHSTVGQSFESRRARFKLVMVNVLSVDKRMRNLQEGMHNRCCILPNKSSFDGGREPRKCSLFCLSFFRSKGIRLLQWHLPAAGSDASITDQKKNGILPGDVKIVVESHDGDKIHIRVELTSEQTQKAFDDVLVNLARSAPPMPGFRRTKGGKTSNVPKSLLIQMLGQDRVTKFVIQEIVSTTMRDYVEKEKLLVKGKIDTSQTAEELESAFSPGSEFGFNATIKIEKPDSEKNESGNASPGT